MCLANGFECGPAGGGNPKEIFQRGSVHLDLGFGRIPPAGGWAGDDLRAEREGGETLGIWRAVRGNGRSPGDS